MADNTTLDAGVGGDAIRDKDRAGVKTQIVGLDLGIGGGSEVLMTAAALADGASNPTTAVIASFLQCFNGATWDRVRGDTANGVDVDVTRSALPTGAATSAKQPTLGTAGAASADVISVQGVASMTPVKTDGSGVTQPVSGPLTDTQLRATPVPVSGTVTANGAVTNAGTFAVQDSQKVADNAGFTDGTTPVQPAGYVFDEVAGTALTENDAAAARIDAKRAQVTTLEDATTRGQRAAVSAGGALKVDGSAATQPVSGTVTANLAAGTNNIGDVDVLTLPANASVNQAQVAGTTTDTNSGNKSAGTQRVVLATDQPQLTNALKVDPSGVTSPVSGSIVPIPATSGGLAPAKVISAASTNATSVKGSAGQLYMLTASNVNAAVRYVKIYDKATAPTVGTDVPKFTFAIPGNTAGAGTNIPIPDVGVAFASGIALAMTTGATDADTGAVAANEIIANLGYK